MAFFTAYFSYSMQTQSLHYYYKLHNDLHNEAHWGLKASAGEMEMLQRKEDVALCSSFTLNSRKTEQAITELMLLHYSVEGNSMLTQNK